MKIAVLANEESWNELVTGMDGITFTRCEGFSALLQNSDADACFNLLDNAADMDYSGFENPVFINSVHTALGEIKTGKNTYRINGWHGFIKRAIWEIAGSPDVKATTVLSALQKKAVAVPDEPGFIAARIIAMIVNEAYFAKEEKVSTENEIDIAMKLGTNYPFGPFEWSRKIGIGNIYLLLKKLSIHDKRYIPCLLMQQETEK